MGLLYTRPNRGCFISFPLLEKSPTAAKLSNPKNTAKQESFVEPVNLRQLVIGLNEPNHEMKIPYVTVNENWETIDGTKTETVFTGVGILSKDSFKGYIKGKAARGIEWMNDETKQGKSLLNWKITRKVIS